MPDPTYISLTDPEGAVAVVAPELGGWLLRYARPLPKHGLVEALHFSQAVVDRYPREMYAGNPLLFPQVSFNHLPDADHRYEWNGRRGEMGQHGFARRSRWSVVSQTGTAVTLELTDTEATRAQYPFAFAHRLTYRLDGGRLELAQTVVNRGDEPMPFSTGIHPYFAVPLTARSEREACFIDLPDARRLIAHGRYDRFTAEPFLAQNWSVAEDVADTMFLTDLKRRELVLVDPVSELEVALNFEGAPQHRYVAIWAKTTEAPFYCLEPWTALPNAFNRPKEHGLIVLPPGQEFHAQFGFEVRPMA